MIAEIMLLNNNSLFNKYTTCLFLIVNKTTVRCVLLPVWHFTPLFLCGMLNGLNSYLTWYYVCRMVALTDNGTTCAIYSDPKQYSNLELYFATYVTFNHLNLVSYFT